MKSLFDIFEPIALRRRVCPQSTLLKNNLKRALGILYHRLAIIILLNALLFENLLLSVIFTLARVINVFIYIHI